MTCSCIDIVAPTISVGKLERRNPLPAGDYWIDLIGEESQAAFAAWSFDHANSVLVLVTENYEARGDFPSRDWVKFQTNAPLAWDAKALGFPNIIQDGESVDSSSDTVSGMEPEECDIACQAKKAGMIAGGVLALGFLLLMVKR